MSAVFEPLEPEPLPDPPERLVLRTQRPVVIIATIAMSIMAVVCAGGGLLVDRTGLSLALVCVAIAVAGEYVIVGGYLWADAERIGSTRFLEWRTVPRNEIAFISITPLRRQCCFMRSDRSIAFRTPGTIFGASQLSLLARYLGVPIYGLKWLSF
jgi:hypothetical protein